MGAGPRWCVQGHADGVRACDRGQSSMTVNTSKVQRTGRFLSQTWG